MSKNTDALNYGPDYADPHKDRGSELGGALGSILLSIRLNKEGDRWEKLENIFENDERKSERMSTMFRQFATEAFELEKALGLWKR